MDRCLSCECGFYAASSDLDELIERGRRHARTVHAMELSTDQLVALTRPVDVPKAQVETDTGGGEGWVQGRNS
jgi:predicted small metal-binding protein